VKKPSGRLIREFAPAKINLALHVTARRSDGYHTLDSIVCFAAVGDTLDGAPDNVLTLEIDGPHAQYLGHLPENLVRRAARLVASDLGARLILTKNLPVAAGLGGGSADAAAALRLLAKLWDLPTPSLAQSLTLGADVPVCLYGKSARMSGIGQSITPIDHMPSMPAVLVNPGVPLSTKAVFQALENPDSAPLSPVPVGGDTAVWLDYLRAQRNDLEAVACTLVPEIRQVLQVLQRQKGSAMTRMSGSGASCFGLFDSVENAALAAESIALDHPAWWVHDTVLA